MTDETGTGPSQARRRGATAWPWVRTLLLVTAGAALVLGATRVPDAGAGLSLGQGPGPQAGGTAPPDQEPVTDVDLACAGAEQQGVEDATVQERGQSVRVRAVAAPAQALPEGIEPPEEGFIELTRLPQLGAVPDSEAVPEPEAVPESEVGRTQERGVEVALGIEGPHGAGVRGEGGLAMGLVAAQQHLSTEEQQRGLAIAGCTRPATDSWLLAGGDQPGRVERLVLVNPGANPVTVVVEVLGGAGPVPAPGGQGIVVGPGDRSVLLLDALAPGQATPAVHVTSTGGPVIAALGDRWLEGSLDRGLELTTASAAPSTGLVVPGLSMPGDGDEGEAALRVGVPGETGAVVQVRALTADGPVRVERDVTLVGAGHAVDIDVSDLPAGTHALEITSDEPVVAAARVERRTESDGVADLAWVPATEPVVELAGAPLMDLSGREVLNTLALASREGATVQVVTSGVDGQVDSQEIEVPAATSLALELGDSTAAWVRPVSGDVHAAVVSTHEDPLGTLIGGMPLVETPLTRPAVEVTPWRP
ncbi:hypothetical protein BH24ACT8_BH24ACT8_04400 [soil metagenome]